MPFGETAATGCRSLDADLDGDEAGGREAIEFLHGELGMSRAVAYRVHECRHGLRRQSRSSTRRRAYTPASSRATSSSPGELRAETRRRQRAPQDPGRHAELAVGAGQVVRPVRTAPATAQLALWGSRSSHGRRPARGRLGDEVGSGLSVLLLNWLFRFGVKGHEEREAEDAARDYLTELGHWPDE